MRERLQQIIARIDGLSLRERGLLMLAVLAVLIGIWEVAFFGPLKDRQNALQQQTETLRTSVAALNQTITLAANKSAEDPNAALREELATVKQANSRLDGQLDAITAGLIAPREMATVLERVLKAQHELKLISIANLPARAVTLGDEGDPDAAKVFRHGLTITFEGSYLDTLKYLEALDGLPWHFYWDRLDFEVKHYPLSSVTLTVHTLNLEEGWIGV